MESFRKWFYKPKKDDTSLLAQFFYADEDLNTVTAELDSFDGRKDPGRCTILVNHLRQCQDKVLNICGNIMNQLIPNERASRDFRVKFPDDVMQENLAGQLWFGAECLAAGSSIMNRENESSAMRPLAKALTKSLENVRNLLREQCFRMNANIQTNNHLFNDKLLEALKIFDKLFAEFELRYVSAMVPVKSPREYYLQQLVVVLFSETLQRALRLNLLTQDMVDDYDPALMFAIPRLAIVSGLLIFPEGPICVDGVPDDTSEMFRPFRFLLRKIRALLLTLSNKELFTLEKLLCSCEDPNIDFSDTNSYSKCIEENEKQDDYIEDDVDYESIGSNKIVETVTSLSPLINVSESVPSESTNETAFTPTKTDSISISNDTSTSGYLIANQVNLNCITTPNEAPIIVGHSLPDGDEDESINLVTETLSSLLNTNTNDSSETVLNNHNINDSDNFKNSVEKCTCFDSKCICFQNICNCFETAVKNYSESANFETGIIKNRDLTGMLKCNSVQKISYLNQSERLVSPDSGLENSELENAMSDRSSDDKMNSPSTSKENSSPSSEKKDFVCDICGKARKERRCSSLGLIEPRFLDTSSSPFLNQPLKDSSLLDQCTKSNEENKAVVEEKNEEWYGIATGQGDAKSSDVNFYFQNEEFSESPIQSHLQQHYWSNWELFIPLNNVGQAQVENNEDSVSLELPANFVINSADERQITNSSENYRIRTSTLIPLQNFENSSNPHLSHCRRLSNLSVARKGDSAKQKKTHKSRNNVPNSKENLPVQIASHSKRPPNPSQIGSSLSSSCSSCVTSETCSLSSDTSSFNSELQDDEEIALALKAAEAAYRDDTRARFRSSEDLIHRLFVCIAGVADQLQTNFAGDLRNILKSVFLMNASETEYEDENEERENNITNGSDLSRVESAEEAGENSASSETERNEEPTVSEGSGRIEENRKEKENPPPWIPDVMAPRCMTCEAVFTLVRRRHHCRNCGKVFCARCSSNSVPLPRYGHIKPVRVCNRCFLYQLVNESKNLKEGKLKSKKSSSKIPMVDASTISGLDQVLNNHHVPVKVKFPSTSELLMIEEYRQSMNTSHKRFKGRSSIDFSEMPVKVITGKQAGYEKKIRKRRGRPSKNKNFSSKPLDCGVCDFKAESFYDLEGHSKTHSDQSMYECTYCNSAFSQKGNLITHIRTHTKEKPFKCLICDFSASQKVNLQVHIRIHTKEKPFKCSICDFSTAQKCNLVAHVTRRHSNVEVVKALETCDNHWRGTDSQLKFYRCGYCTFTCRLKREMVDHVKLHHSFSTYEFQTIDILK